jgi:diguanylate cyclase (GGDEF)-like protein
MGEEMGRSRLLPFIVAAAVAMIVVTNYSIVMLLPRATKERLDLFYAVWPLVLTSTTAILLVMSSLYQALQSVLHELEEREVSARDAGLRDPLTNLGNRNLLADRLDQSTSSFRRNGRPFALLMLDLDRFKDINDIHGHPIGDALLIEVATRLREVVRDTDTLIRFGGDEFVVLQNDIEAAHDVERLSQRIHETLRQPFIVDTHELTVGASVGAILADGAPNDASEYIRKADIALYEAKRRGRNRIEFYSSKLDSELQRRTEIERELANAISRESIDVHYQPQVNIEGDVIAAEALLRWNSKRFGPITPGEIVNIAEDSGLIRPLGKLVLRKACKAAKHWPGLTVAVNFSPSQLLSYDLPAKLVRICREEGVSCDQIELELTESLFADDGEGCEELIAVLRECGFKIALDDFGAGYSSLRYLRRFKVDKVKLDKGFSDGSEAHQNIAIIRAAVMLAHALGLTVIAEGIETADQEQMAIQGGCDGFQGFRYAPAMTPQQLTEFLKNRRASAA